MVCKRKQESLFAREKNLTVCEGNPDSPFLCPEHLQMAAEAVLSHAVSAALVTLAVGVALHQPAQPPSQLSGEQLVTSKW